MERIEWEKKVIRTMVEIYCNKNHGAARGGDGLCQECRSLLEYAEKRLDHCPKGNGKSSCRKCTIHCYAPAQRQQMREVMRFVGPRMIRIHPWMAIRHLISELR